MSLVELTDICMTYRGEGAAPTEALRHVSVAFELGETCAVTGESGSGKSTLLNIIAGLLTPSTGRRLFEGKDITRLSDKESCGLRNRRMGIIVQDFALLEQSTVLDNCLLPAILAGKKKREARERALALLAQLSLDDLAGKKARNLSGGQRQRVAIARALMNKPDLILADEPTGALDSENAQRIINVLLDEQKRGAAVILVTHNLSYASLCQRHFTLRDGVIAV